MKIECPICLADIMSDPEHWHGGMAKCPIRAYARREDLESDMANWAIRGIDKAAVVKDEKPIIINLPLAIFLDKAPKQLKTLVAKEYLAKMNSD